MIGEAAPGETLGPNLLALGRVPPPRPDEGLHHPGIQLLPGPLEETPQGLLWGKAFAVRAVRGHGLVGVGYRQDMGQEGDLLPLEASGVSLAVVALMVPPHRGAYLPQ